MNEELIAAKRTMIPVMLEDIIRSHPELQGLCKEVFTEYSQQARRLDEEVTAGDWARIGVVVGLLWTKLDAITTTIRDGNRGRDEVQRKLGDILTELRRRK